MSETKVTPEELANQFMALGQQDFNRFWISVFFEWNQEDGDVEAQWFYNGQAVKPSVLTVIGALHSAVYSGTKAGLRK